jgi:hypothetical protein
MDQSKLQNLVDFLKALGVVQRDFTVRKKISRLNVSLDSFAQKTLFSQCIVLGVILVKQTLLQ